MKEMPFIKTTLKSQTEAHQIATQVSLAGWPVTNQRNGGVLLKGNFK